LQALTGLFLVFHWEIDNALLKDQGAPLSLTALQSRVEQLAPEASGRPPAQSGPAQTAKVIGFRAEITGLTPRFKLGQDESETVRQSIINALEDTPLGHWMKAANKPGLQNFGLSIIQNRRFKLNPIALRINKINRHPRPLRPKTRHSVACGKAPSGQMRPQRRLIERRNGKADMVKVATRDRRIARPAAQRPVPVHQIHQRRPGPQMRHAQFVALPHKLTAQRLGIKLSHSPHVANPDHHMIKRNELKRCQVFRYGHIHASLAPASPRDY